MRKIRIDENGYLYDESKTTKVDFVFCPMSFYSLSQEDVMYCCTLCAWFRESGDSSSNKLAWCADKLIGEIVLDERKVKKCGE